MRVSIADRRKATRVPVDFEIKYRVLRGQKIEGMESDEYRTVKARNVSQYGIAIGAKDPLEEGDILHANFSIDGREIDAFCAVVWSEYNANLDEYEVGLEFDFLGQYDGIFLVQYIKRTLERFGIR
jgi:c-di-GMP-binding flagellar brake protein YcgR